jgi:hypothetical protein
MRNLSTTMKTKPQKPTKQIALGELSGAVVLQTCNIENQTFAYLVEDERYMVAIDGNDQHEDAVKEWFKTWFAHKHDHYIRLHRAKNDQGELFTIQIKKQTNGL